MSTRFYPGASGDFDFYEDEGDNYDYEREAYSVIPLHWDNRAETLTIGDRRGSFPGALENRTFRIVLVREGHGTGVCTEFEAGRHNRLSGQSNLRKGAAAATKLSSRDGRAS